MNRRHPLFVRDGRNIRHIQAVMPADVGFHAHALGQYRPPDQGMNDVSTPIDKRDAGRILDAGHELLVRRECVVRLVDKVRPLYLPIWRRVVVVVVANLVAVFQNAPHFDAGQGEDFAFELAVSALGDQQVFRLGGKRNHSSIRMDGAGDDVGDLGVAAQVGELDRGQFLALFLEHLDARVDALVVQRIVVDLLEVEIDGRGNRRLGVVRHLQFFGSGLLKLGASQGRSH